MIPGFPDSGVFPFLKLTQLRSSLATSPVWPWLHSDTQQCADSKTDAGCEDNGSVYWVASRRPAKHSSKHLRACESMHHVQPLMCVNNPGSFPTV
eukprot:1152451-Amphidinium_carterae.1